MKCLVFFLMVVGVIMVLVVSLVLVDLKWEDKVKDVWIDGKVEVMFFFNIYLNFFDINIDVQEGVIILIGKVDSSVDKKLVEELVIGIDGVVLVDNCLIIIESDDEEMISEEIFSDFIDVKIVIVVKFCLFMDIDIFGFDIDVDVENSEVILKGIVSSEVECVLVVEIVKNVLEVKFVDDQFLVVEFE